MKNLLNADKIKSIKKFKEFFRFLSYTDIGIDLGTANTIVYKSGKGIILREPSVVAIDTAANRVVAVGQEAKDMIGRTPDSIRAVRPLKEGVIADFECGSAMLRYFLKKTMGNKSFTKKRILICIPFGVTDVEHRAVENAAYETGAKDVRIIEEPLAAAIGAGLPVGEPTGSMVVDIGGGTSEVAVISLGGIVTSRSVRIAGDAFDTAIVAYVKKHFNLLIGDRMAEEIKFEIGSAHPYDNEGSMSVRGRDLITGLPKNIDISAAHIREALAESIQVVIDAIKQTLEDTPPELAADIIDHGITLTGGGAMLRGLDVLINKVTGMPVHIAEDPLDCVALGTGKSLENPVLWATIAR
ncbi:MAG: rod shape-determining protein [Clostridia bacterium]|nr:rod shape-determining protein [Clostridia bacterium]